MDYSQQAAEWASQHKCPGCGGEMAYDGTNDCLRCKQCGNTVAVDASLGEVFEYAYSHPETAFNLQWGQQKVSLRCKNCGASGEYDVLAAADFCPFCGGSVVLCGEDPPDGVIPFKMEEEDIFSHLQNWFKTKKMAPGKFKKLARIANPRASFVPFWTYDAHVETSYTAEVGEDETRTIPTPTAISTPRPSPTGTGSRGISQWILTICPSTPPTARISLTRTAIPSARRSCSPIAARCWQANSLKSPTSTGGRAGRGDSAS